MGFIAAGESQGCTATGDTGFSSGPATGSFSGLGEEICLNLPTASGQSDYFFDQPPSATASVPAMDVVDATGAQQCSSANGDFTYATCELSGTGPFRIILSNPDPTGQYRVLTQNTTSTAGCSDWPQSGFGGSYGATATLTASSDVKCLTIPAAQHSTGEMIDYSNPANTVDGAIYVNDPSGHNVCTGTSLSLCSYQSGVTYTALVVTTAANGDTYDLVRRDVSQTAKCGTPASTTVGGPSTTFALTSDLDTVCYRITGATADKLWLSARTPGASAPAGADLLVTNASGALVCRQFGTACQVTGDTDYQVIVDASGYAGTPISTHLDTWRVGTASGWAPQCTKNQYTAANGWGPVSGTLTEGAAGYCAVVAIQPSQQFAIYGTDSAQSPDMAMANIYPAENWSGYGYGTNYGLCYGNNVGQFDFTCQVPSSQAAESAVLIVSPYDSPLPDNFTMQGVPLPAPTATVTSISPASGTAGPGHTIVVTGTGLNLGTQVSIASNGSTVATAVDKSVNAAGTSLTVTLDTTGVTPGTYDIVLDSPGYTAGTPSPGYLPGAYTVTAATGSA